MKSRQLLVNIIKLNFNNKGPLKIEYFFVQFNVLYIIHFISILKL